MAVRTKEEIFAMFKERFGDSTDEAIFTLLEDVNDTLDDYDERLKNAGDWKAKYEENDRAWRERYRDRFFNKTVIETTEGEPSYEGGENRKVYRYEDLFKED